MNLWELILRGHLKTDVQAGLELGTFRSRERCLTARPQLHMKPEILGKIYSDKDKKIFYKNQFFVTVY